MSGFLESFLTRGWWVVCLEVSFMPCWHLGSSLSLSPSLVLFAMKEDNEKVPTLLTDYILKGESSPQGPWIRASRRPLRQGTRSAPQPSRSVLPAQTAQGGRPGAASGRLGGPHRNGVLSLHVARRPEKEIPSPWSPHSDSTSERTN